jgi:hypothetical protein
MTILETEYGDTLKGRQSMPKKFAHVSSLHILCIRIEFGTYSRNQPVLEWHRSLCGNKTDRDCIYPEAWIFSITRRQVPQRSHVKDSDDYGTA